MRGICELPAAASNTIGAGRGSGKIARPAPVIRSVLGGTRRAAARGGGTTSSVGGSDRTRPCGRLIVSPFVRRFYIDPFSVEPRRHALGDLVNSSETASALCAVRHAHVFTSRQQRWRQNRRAEIWPRWSMNKSRLATACRGGYGWPIGPARPSEWRANSTYRSAKRSAGSPASDRHLSISGAWPGPSGGALRSFRIRGTNRHSADQRNP